MLKKIKRKRNGANKKIKNNLKYIYNVVLLVKYPLYFIK